jgi:hypothetical protein
VLVIHARLAACLSFPSTLRSVFIRLVIDARLRAYIIKKMCV